MDSIFHRISVRRYEDKQVEKEKLMQILRAGMQAPSACNQQPWEFYVVTNPEKIKALSKATPYAGCAANAPVVIVPVYRKEGLMAPDFAQIDLSIAQENMWLETDAQGLRRRCGGAAAISFRTMCGSQKSVLYRWIFAGGIILPLGGISDGYLCRCCSSISVCLVSGISAIYERTRYESKVGVSELGKP